MKLFLTIFIIIFSWSCSKKNEIKLNPDQMEQNISIAVTELKEQPLVYDKVFKDSVLRTKDYVKWAAIGGVLIIGSAIAIFAPHIAIIVGGWIGSTFSNLSGAAAISHGLALLGGGSLVSGGGGMMLGKVILVSSLKGISSIIRYSAFSHSQAIAKNSENKFFEQASKEFQIENYNLAKAIYRESILNGKDVLKAYYSLGLINFQNKNYEEALKIFQCIKKYSPNSTLSSGYEGYTLAALGKTQEAVDSLENTIKREPEWDQPYLTLSQVLLINGKEKDSFNILIQGSRNSNFSFNLNYQLGLYFSNKQDWQAAEAYFSKAIDIDNNFPDIFMYRGMCNEKQNNVDKALDDYLSMFKILKATTPYLILHKIGLLYLKQNKIEQAMDFFQKEKLNIETKINSTQIEQSDLSNLKKWQEEVEKELNRFPISPKKWWKIF